VRKIKNVLFALLAIAAIGALTVMPARRSQASVDPYPHPVYLPDLVVSQVEPVYAGGYGRFIGYLVPDEVWVQVTNQGSGYAGTFECFFEWDFGYGNEQEFFWLLGGLAPGQSTWVKASSNGYNLWAANHQFRFTVNYGHYITESDYTNNNYDGP
jgi:hypothetical protein